MLASLVAAGKLPPVEERLPVEPPVVEPVERIGQYGGAWDTPMLGASDNYWIQRTICYEGLVRWPREWKGLAGTSEITQPHSEGLHRAPSLGMPVVVVALLDRGVVGVSVPFRHTSLPDDLQHRVHGHGATLQRRPYRLPRRLRAASHH